VPFIKICGIQSYEEARLALDCGATALGFLVGLTHRAEDEISETAARDIVRRLPAGAGAVLVTHLLDPREIAVLAAAVRVRAIQIHGDMAVADVARLAQLAPDFALVKAVHVTGAEAVARAVAFMPVAGALVLDSRTADRLGGTGRTHDWSISRRIVQAVAPMPVYLAGGLTPANVADAVAQVGPAGVDVNSGVEDGAGRKDRARMAVFISAAHQALSAGPQAGS